MFLWLNHEFRRRTCPLLQVHIFQQILTFSVKFCFCTEIKCNTLFHFSTCFQHPHRHLVTWYSNDGVTTNQIDHILVKARWASSVLDCHAYRGAETGSEHGSDHVLVRAKMRLRLKVNKNSSLAPRFDVAKLKCRGIQDAFRLQLSNRFNGLEALQTDSAPAEAVWRSFKHTVRTTARETLG